MSDVIYRQSAIDAIRLTSSPWLTELIDPYRAQVKALKELPSAQKKGHWVKARGMMPPEFFGGYVCSECDGWAPRDWRHSKLLRSPFCPNCGADMREEE